MFDGSDDEAGPARIRVQASGVTRGEPDLLTVTLGVQTRAATATEALADNNERAQAVLDLLRDRGAAEEDIQTSQVSVRQDRDREGRPDDFVVSNRVTARLRELDRAGALIDAVAGVAGDAVRVDGLSFSIEDPAAAGEDARVDAVRRARAQAEQLAEAAGVELGELRSIRETPTSTPFDGNRSSLDSEASSAGSVPLAPGSLEVRVHVELVYDVAD